MPFYNPSKIVTDVLSKYLEFDSEQLKLGIWSGNLSIRDVELKREAMYPLLNGTSPQKLNGKPPLNLKLVKGTVGHMRIRIPWKRLVWGQGDVKLQISDVTIAVGYESREETAARNLPKEKESKAPEEEEQMEESEDTKRKERDMKQEWLREAERCQLQGVTLPSMHDMLAENADQESNKADGQTSGISKSGRLDSWLKSTTESFAWRFVAGLDASIRNVRVVIVQDGVEIGTIFHSMDIVPRSLDVSALTDREKEEEEHSSSQADPTLATPPPDVVPQGEYDDGEHLDKIVKLQGFGVFVRLEDKTNTTPKTLRFSTSVAADDYILRPTKGDLAVSIFDPYPTGKQAKKKVQTIEEEPTTPTTATDTVDSVTSSKSRRSKREKRPLVSDETQTAAMSETQGSAPENAERPPKELRPALKRPARVSSSTRQFSLAETPTSTGATNRPKSHTVDLSRGTTSGGQHERKTSAISRANLSRVTSTGHRSRVSNMSGRSNPLSRSDETSTAQSPGGAVMPPSLDLHLSFGDVTTMFSSRHYKLILEFKSTVERMKNGRPDKSIASGLDGLGPDKKRAVYVDAPTSAVKNANDPAFTSQLPSSAIKSSSRPTGVHRAKTTGGADFSTPPERVKLQLQLELPSLRDENQKVVKSWWQYAYTAVLYETKQRKTEEASFDAKRLKMDWEKQTQKRKEYVELYIATRLEPSSVLRSMELKVKLGAGKSPEEELLKIEDELPVEQILLYRSIARSLRVRGMKRMPDSVLDIHGRQWLKSSPPRKKTTASKTDPLVPSVSQDSDSVSSAAGTSKDAVLEAARLAVVELDCTDVNGIRQEADAVRMRTSFVGDPKRQKSKLRAFSRDDTHENSAASKRPGGDTRPKKEFNEKVGSNGGREPRLDAKSATKVDNFDGRTVRTFKTAKTSQTGSSAGVAGKDSSSGRMRISASIAFSKVELMIYQETKSVRDSFDSMRFRLASSGLSTTSGVLDTRIRSSVGLQVVTNEDAHSEVSDVSILSDDQLFFDQNDDTLSIPERESVGDFPIMSSADFLMFGLPRSILLHASISGLVGKTRGQSGSQQIISLSVDDISIEGDKNCHLMSLKATSLDTARPLDVVHVENQEKPARNRTALSFTEIEAFQEQAILVSVVSKETGTRLQCDLSRTVVTCDLNAAMKIYDFFADVHVTFPQPLTTLTQISKLRQYVLKSLVAEKRGLNNTGEGVSTAIRLHGLEIGVPGSSNSLSSKDDESSQEASVCSDTEPKVKICSSLIEYYDGALFEDIFMLSTDFGDEGSWMTSELPTPRRNLNKINATRFADEYHAPSSTRHLVSL